MEARSRYHGTFEMLSKRLAKVVRGIGSCGRNKTKPMSEIVQGEPEISTPIRFPPRLRPTWLVIPRVFLSNMS